MDHHEHSGVHNRSLVDPKAALQSKHHDAALDVLGGDRVVMTDEQVRCSTERGLQKVATCLPQDRQTHLANLGLGLLFADL